MHHASGISQTWEETEKRGVDKEEVMHAQLRVKTLKKKLKPVIIYTYEGFFFAIPPKNMPPN